MEPFEVYKMYLALKLHFTTPSYDIVKHKGAVRGKKDTFLRRRDLTSIRKLARDYSKKEITDFLVANFVSGDKWGGVFDTEASERYSMWLTKRQRLLYTLSKDLETIILNMELGEIDSAIYDEGHPLIFKLFLGGEIELETLVILDKILPFTKQYSEDFVLKDYCLLVNKYKPFIKINKDEIFNKHKDKLKKVYGNVKDSHQSS